LTAVLGGQADVYFVTSSSSIQFIKAGKLSPLAVKTATRYEASVWFGVGAPKGTPTQIVMKLNDEINAGLSDTKVAARFTDIGVP
jgi:tripartite-type tricarboxylate transporter receptor subunit TctC